MSDSNIKSIQLNKNVQKFIKVYGTDNDNIIIKGIQNLILRWCGMKVDISNIPKKSVDIFKSMIDKDIVIPLSGV